MINEKILDLQKDQSRMNCSNKKHNSHDNNRSNFDNTYFHKNLTVKKSKSVETLQFKITGKFPFNANKKKVTVVGNSIKKLFRSDELSTS